MSHDTKLSEFLSNLKLQLASNTVVVERAKVLNSIATYVSEKLLEKKTVNLMFVCTHNSRRSQLAQIWAHIAKREFNLHGIASFSAGTESTAFHPNAVAALTSQGIELKKRTEGKNPIYSLIDQKGAIELEFWSKSIDDPTLPKSDLVAIMVCSDADQNCPFLPGSDQRFKLTYKDPKESDGREDSNEVYCDRSNQIALEMLYLMERIREA